MITLSDEPRTDIQAFLARHPVATVNGRVERFEHFDIGGMRPMTMIVDRDGVLRRVMWGARTYAQFIESLQPYL